LICSRQYGSALSSLLEFKKEIAGGSHPVSIVVDLAPKKVVVISVQSVAAQKLAFGKYTYAFIYSCLSLFHISHVYQDFMIMVHQD
jgi:molybdopterin-binding protein